MENVLSIPISVDISDPGVALTPIVHKTLFPSSQESPNTLNIEIVQGGITNALYLCTIVETGDKVIARVFGKNTEFFVDRRKETIVSVFAASRRFGKRILSFFEGGRIEEYLCGRSLSPKEANDPDLVPKIATHLGRMHRLEPPIDKSPSFWRHIEKFIHCLDSTELNTFWKTNLDNIRKQKEVLRHSLNECTSPVVFSHNDLLPGNIIINGQEIQFIDFEYADYNFRGFDIANHFCECCGFECEWDNFPNREQQILFISAYLSALGDNTTSLENVMKEVCPWIAASHLFWGLWSLLQSSISSIEFDFESYAEKRLLAFEEAMSNHKNVF